MVAGGVGTPQVGLSVILNPLETGGGLGPAEFRGVPPASERADSSPFANPVV
jgi:hypothetical protein